MAVEGRAAVGQGVSGARWAAGGCGKGGRLVGQRCASCVYLKMVVDSVREEEHMNGWPVRKGGAGWCGMRMGMGMMGMKMGMGLRMGMGMRMETGVRMETDLVGLGLDMMDRGGDGYTSKRACSDGNGDEDGMRVVAGTRQIETRSRRGKNTRDETNRDTEQASETDEGRGMRDAGCGMRDDGRHADAG